MRSGYYTVLGLIACMLAGCDTSKNIDLPDEYYFIKYYGGDGDQSGVDMIQLEDGNLLLLGNSQKTINNVVTNKIYLVKADPLGKALWEKYLGSATDMAKDIEPTADGNFVILSSCYTSSPEDTDIKLIRVTPEGDKIDSVIYGSSINGAPSGKKDSPSSVTALLDGGFIVTGATQADESDFNPADPEAFSNIFHFRCNSDLKFDALNWVELYGSRDQYDAATKVIQESNDRFYVFGYSSQSHGSKNSSKLNLQYYSIESGGIAGNVGYIGEEEKEDFNQDTRSVSVSLVPQELGKGFLILSTTTTSSGTTLWISKLRSPLQFNPQNDILLNRQLSLSTRALEAVSATSCTRSVSGYLLLGNETRALGKNIWLTKIDQSGNALWSVSLGSEDEDDSAAAVTELPDGKIIVLGTVRIGDNQSKMALFKLNSGGRLEE